MKPSKPSGFVIYGAMRTGSNFLVSILNQFPGVVCHGEAFNPGFVGLREDYYEKFGLTREEPQKRYADVAGFYERILEQRGTDEISGFKLFPGHSDSVLQRTLTDPSLAKVVLKRDLLTSFISLCQAEQTGVWMIKDTDDRRLASQRARSDQRIEFNGPRFLNYRTKVLDFYREVESAIRARDERALVLWYKELTLPETLQKLGRLLGTVPPPLLESAELLAKQNSSAPHERVANLCEMVDFVRQHRLESPVIDAAQRLLASSPRVLQAQDPLRPLIGGVKVDLSNQALSQEVKERVRSGTFEAHKSKCVAALVADDDRILEVGGGIGYTSSVAWCSGRGNDIKVVEANPDAINSIRATHILNGVTAEVIHGAATFSEQNSATVPFYIRSDLCKSSLSPEPQNFIRRAHVPRVNLQNIIDSQSTTFLILDVKGEEATLLARLRIPSIQKILVQLRPEANGLPGVRDLFAGLNTEGFAYDPSLSRGTIVVFRRVSEG